MRAIGASEKIASVNAGRMSCFRLAQKTVQAAGDQAVDQVEAGDLRRRAGEHVEAAERRRRPAEQVIEHIDQNQAGEEHRQRHARGGDHAAGMVDQRAGMCRRRDAERHRDQHRHQQAEQRQLGRRRQPALDLLADRLAGGQRIAEVAVGQIVDVIAELHDERLVETKLDADLLDRLLGRGRPREIGGWITRQGTRQQECDDDDADQARHREHRALQDHAQHGYCPGPLPRLGSSWPGSTRPSTSSSQRKEGVDAPARGGV